MDYRPMYETQFDLKNENNAKLRVETAFKCVLHKLPISYSADWVATRNNNIIAVLEYKKRMCEKDKFPTTFVFVDKWIKGQQLSDTMKVPFFLLIKWTEGLYWHQVGTSPVTFKVSGRTDREDPQDIQPAVHIPVTAFTKVK